MTEYKITKTGPGGITRRSSGEVAFADLTISVDECDVPIRIQTKASDAGRPVFTIDDGALLIAHGQSAIAAVEAAVAKRAAALDRSFDRADRLTSMIASGGVALTDEEIRTGSVGAIDLNGRFGAMTLDDMEATAAAAVRVGSTATDDRACNSAVNILERCQSAMAAKIGTRKAEETLQAISDKVLAEVA
ncbi:hypothetical protein U5903_04330 [Cereibacter johrii]|uniref:hypothetical protein n=1 Tax=Cereibacter johrii TaxID=445629 RepID=UPI002B257C9E|nr:hypothetical protein [Cereibacter johrii]MEA5159996.1 hypothetical protein [Cereibacter johrii]